MLTTRICIDHCNRYQILQAKIYTLSWRSFRNRNMRFHPEKQLNMIRHWANNFWLLFETIPVMNFYSSSLWFSEIRFCLLFDGKNNLNINLRIFVCHYRSLLRSFLYLNVFSTTDRPSGAVFIYLIRNSIYKLITHFSTVVEFVSGHNFTYTWDVLYLISPR